MTCMYCDEQNEVRNKILIKVCDLPNSTLFLLKNQNHLGRVVVALKTHREELFMLTDEERQGFFSDAARVSKAMKELFNPGKINYGVFGDGVPHFHMHLVPKYKDGLQWGHFFWDKGLEEVTLTDEEYAKMAADYRAKLGV